LVTTSPQF